MFQINMQPPLTKTIYSYFDIQRLESLDHKRKRATEEFLKRIKKIKLPHFVLLFGSTAKENYTETSDIDLIIIYEDYDQKMGQQIEAAARNTFAETGLVINFILMKLEEFLKEKNNKENHALQDALQTGYPVIGNSFFYEVMTD